MRAMKENHYLWTLFLVFIINTLSVQPERYPPRFRKKPKLQTNVRLGNNIRLRCSVKGDPAPTLTWVKDQTPLQFSSRIRLISRGNGSVKITNTQFVDAGNYTCIAANFLGKVNATLELHVHQDAPPSFTDQSFLERRYREWPASHTIRLKCEATGAPPLQFRWLKDGQRLLSRRMDPYRSSSQSFLRLRDVIPDDSGNYTCIVNNPYGSINQTYTVKVVGAPPSFTDQSFLERRYKALPVLNNLRLMCEATGTPPLQFRWLKDGQRLLSRRMDRYLNSSLWFLRLRYVVPEDSGKYTCIVTNPYGSINNTYTLKVVARPRSRPILRSGLPRSTTAKVGDNIALKCVVRASAYPRLPDFRWFKWDRNITSEPKISISSMMKANGLHQLVDPVRYTTIKVGEHHGVQLEIYNVTENDYGLYTCFVTNHIGYDYSSAFVMKVGISSKPPSPTTSGQGERGSPIKTQNWTTASAEEQPFVRVGETTTQINLVNVIIIMVAIVILMSVVIACVLFVLYRKLNRNVTIDYCGKQMAGA